MSTAQEIKRSILSELDQTNALDMPYLHAALYGPNSTEDDLRQAIETIFTTVLEQHCTISEAITQLENTLNPNSYTQ